MKYQIISVLLVFGLMVFIPNIQNSFGHGLGTETMPPEMIDGIESTLQVASTTSLDTGIRQITISLFQTESYEMINNVLFEVELTKNDQQLFKNNFERDGGVLIMNLVPSDDTDVQIINQETIASFLGLASDQFNLKGKVFENGGLYKFNVKILTINSYNNLLPEPIEYNLGISIPETTYYEIDDKNFGKQELGIITYFDQITEFYYDQSNNQVEFSFPFDWDKKTIEQTSVVHEEVVVPRTFGDLLVSDFTASLNGIQLSESSINIDDFSSKKRTIHVVVSQSELQEIFSQNQFDANEITIKIKPNGDNLPMLGVTENGQFKIQLWWENEIKSDSMVTLHFDILDTFLMDRKISVPYDLKIIKDGNQILAWNSISKGANDEKSDKFDFFVPSDSSGILVVKFDYLADNHLAYVEFPLVVDRKSFVSEEYVIPAWVKNNAGWWADGQIEDRTFANGIEFLINAGIIVV